MNLYRNAKHGLKKKVNALFNKHVYEYTGTRGKAARAAQAQESTAGDSKKRKANPRYFRAIATLLGFSEQAGYKVRFCKFECYNGRLKGERIGIREGMTEQETAYTLAHEIAHAYLHCDKGDTICSPNHAEYEEQADRAANMILDLLLYVG